MIIWGTHKVENKLFSPKTIGIWETTKVGVSLLSIIWAIPSASEEEMHHTYTKFI